MSLSVAPLHPVFAAEMVGADLTVPPGPTLIDAVEKAMARYGILVLRDQFISDADHIRFSRAFGPLELPPGYDRAGVNRRMAREIFDASNLTFDTGEILPADAVKRLHNKSAQRFHFDSFYCALPVKWSLLLGHEVPPEKGDTEFADRRAAYERLTADMKAKVEDLELVFDVYESRYRRGLVELSAQKRATFPAPRRFKMVETAADGRKSLCVGPAVDVTEVIGIDAAEAGPLLAQLYEIACDPRYIYAHKWRKGDLVIWDNRCTLHRGTDYDSFNYRRDLRRTSINESGPEVISLTG